MSLTRHTPGVFASTILLVALLLCPNREVLSQDRYIVGAGDQEQGLQMIVHVIGEVRKPGEYRVLDGTNILELFSKAGGPTQFSKLSGVTISRIRHGVAGNGRNGNGRLKTGNDIIRVNITHYLKKTNAAPPPQLKPGDVVFVPRNGWSKWRNIATIVRDVSVGISLYLLYLRARD
ncbi:MAG: polysaccharide biosynthesis/export family protein [bacterium]